MLYKSVPTAHHVNTVENSGFEMKETLAHAEMEEFGSREDRDDAEGGNAIAMEEFGSENGSFYSAQDSVSEKEGLTKTAGDAHLLH
ncbi:uncharacterized protein G2W53_024574 [Senna tora]|uniref:Uncharacterized protein n=1 Tax=Senna tora TaxID=362788 RepID=A0A834TKC0_9FABA|nr:uncharacterized protein G2W53_024574 [Senna tora]